ASSSRGDPDAVLASGERTPVEPAVAGKDLEAGLGEERVPAGGFDPPQRHRRLALRPTHRQRQGLLHEIPVRALVDARLPLDPAALRLLDVLAGGCEDVEDQPPAGAEQLPRGTQRLEALVVVAQVEVGPERACHERDALVDRWPAQVAEPEIEAL